MIVILTFCRARRICPLLSTSRTRTSLSLTARRWILVVAVCWCWLYLLLLMFFVAVAFLLLLFPFVVVYTFEAKWSLVNFFCCQSLNTASESYKKIYFFSWKCFQVHTCCWKWKDCLLPDTWTVFQEYRVCSISLTIYAKAWALLIPLETSTLSGLLFHRDWLCQLVMWL